MWIMERRVESMAGECNDPGKRPVWALLLPTLNVPFLLPSNEDISCA
jgi:hypothetical protein